MTRDEIVEIAWDVGLFMRSHKFQDEPTKLERFAERIAAAEREACARLCLEQGKPNPDDANVEFSHLAAYEFGKQVGAATCATAIRARGEV